MRMTLLCAPLMALLLSCAHSTTETTPEWLEGDSAQAIHARLLRDFPMPYDEGVTMLIKEYPTLSADSFDNYVAKHYVETMEIDGENRIFRKAVRNMGLLNPDLNGGWKHRGWNASAERISYVDSIIKYTEGNLADGGAHRIRVRFVIDVPYHPVLKDDTLRVWMPYPIESERQGDVKFISSFPADNIISDGQQSVHRTIYMQQAVQPDSNTHFEYEVEFTTAGKYVAEDDILKNMKPYDKDSELYQKYTAFDGPHYVKLDSLANVIVGNETNPYKQSELVFDYIINHFPWAGAREYSTIPCIPAYVQEQNHGDCGQVALLYISLMRTLGVPARWESGWMLHPGEKNFHDWAETYYEGVGWVPVDVSFGRYASSPDPKVQTFYSKGIDAYRMATNTGIGKPFYPAKKFIRSETVDCQAGEVECSKGNLFYPAWNQELEIISCEPIAR